MMAGQREPSNTLGLVITQDTDPTIMTTYTLHPILPCKPAITKAIASAGPQPSVTLGLDLEVAGAAGALTIGGGEALHLGKHPRPTFVALVKWLAEQGCTVYCAQEACGFGWQFHHDLSSAGGRSMVVAPELMNGKRKTDKFDARALSQLLWDYHMRSNRKALRPLLVPSAEQQQRRAYSRNRKQWVKARCHMEAQGRSLLHDHSWLAVPKGWWQPGPWAKLKAELVAAGHSVLVELLAAKQTVLVQMQARADELEAQATQRYVQPRPAKERRAEGREGQASSASQAASQAVSQAANLAVSQAANQATQATEPEAVATQRHVQPRPAKERSAEGREGQASNAGQAANQAVQAAASGPSASLPPSIRDCLPKGFGLLSYATINDEVLDWNRFKNRGQPGSFIGCCPREHSSGTKQRLGEIDRQGSGRLRTLLVEAVWRLKRHNGGWRSFVKFADVFGPEAKPSSARKRKAVLACARLLMVDLWRLHTGRATLSGLGLQPAQVA